MGACPFRGVGGGFWEGLEEIAQLVVNLGPNGTCRIFEFWAGHPHGDHVVCIYHVHRDVHFPDEILSPSSLDAQGAVVGHDQAGLALSHEFRHFLRRIIALEEEERHIHLVQCSLQFLQSTEHEPPLPGAGSHVPRDEREHDCHGLFTHGCFFQGVDHGPVVSHALISGHPIHHGSLFVTFPIPEHAHPFSIHRRGRGSRFPLSLLHRHGRSQGRQARPVSRTRRRLSLRTAFRASDVSMCHVDPPPPHTLWQGEGEFLLSLRHPTPSGRGKGSFFSPFPSWSPTRFGSRATLLSPRVRTGWNRKKRWGSIGEEDPLLRTEGNRREGMAG
eukprot:scaffold5_cov331-Pavlova_lutheri.AAC.20